MTRVATRHALHKPFILFIPLIGGDNHPSQFRKESFTEKKRKKERKVYIYLSTYCVCHCSFYGSNHVSIKLNSLAYFLPYREIWSGPSRWNRTVLRETWSVANHKLSATCEREREREGSSTFVYWLWLENVENWEPYTRRNDDSIHY